MKLTFYGVRGSIPASGANTIKYGGNTPCIYIETDDDFHLILDAGTGIIPLGDQLISDTKPIFLLLSHNHWDHIQGFPFFRPAYQPNRRLTILPGLTTPYEPEAILKQMSGTNFPVDASHLSANITIMPDHPLDETLQLGNIKITRMIINHPCGGSAYLFDNDSYRFAYITDNELTPPDGATTTKVQWQKFIQNIDLLIHDAQYYPDDFPAKAGWGHSPFNQVVELAIAANVKSLCLFSHDYRRTDIEIDNMLMLVKQQISQQKSPLQVFAAQEKYGFLFETRKKQLLMKKQSG